MKQIKQTTYILEFYDAESTDEDNTIFSLAIGRLDIPLLTLHQPKNTLFFKIHNKCIKFTVDDQKPREIFYSITEDELTEIKVRVPLCQPENNGIDYKNIPEWWKDITLVS